MKFTVVMPTYNNRELLRNTLEALNYQEGYDENDYEVVVVDDGSSVDTYSYIKGVNKNYKLKYYYLERNQDSCRARTRNHGWKNADGDIIAYIDSDIIVGRNYLKELDRCFSVASDILVLGNRFMLNESIEFDDIATGKIYEKYKFEKENFPMLESRYFMYESSSYNANASLCPWLLCYSCNLAVTKDTLEEIGGFDENFKEWGIEDIEFGYSAYKKKIQIVINNKLEVYHQYHGMRNDLIISAAKIPGYEKNIDYFISKHPKALNMNKKSAYRFLEGDSKAYKLLEKLEVASNVVEFRNKKDYQLVKDAILILSNMPMSKVIVHDYVEDTNLDIWIQLLGYTDGTILYYPMSRRLNKKDMEVFLEEEKAREREYDKRLMEELV